MKPNKLYNINIILILTYLSLHTYIQQDKLHEA
jgi:hypothetical protein